LKVYANFIPLVESGTYPNPLYCKFVTDSSEQPSLESCKQTGKYVNQRTGRRMYFRLSGRQNDFNYWFDTGSQSPSLRLYYYPIEYQNPGLKYTLVVSVLVSFRLPMIPDTNVVEAVKKFDKKHVTMVDEGIQCNLNQSISSFSSEINKSINSNLIAKKLNKRAEIYKTLCNNCEEFGIKMKDLIDRDYNFSLNADDLFIEEGDFIFCLVTFSSVNEWNIGKPLLKKYQFSFNYDQKKNLFL
jgi:hypothetical protein